MRIGLSIGILLFFISCTPEVKLPEYKLAEKFGVHCNVIIPSFTQQTPTGNKDKVAWKLAKDLNCGTVTLYQNEEGIKANESTFYRNSHPGSEKKILGRFDSETDKYMDYN